MIPYMITFQQVTKFMFFPSTVLIIALVYIALNGSPKYMKRYKYVVITVSLSVYQFDFVDSILLCPVNIYKAIGLQFYGYLSKKMPKLNATGAKSVLGENYPIESSLIPRDGFYLMELYCISLIIMEASVLFNFVWKEFSLIPFNRNALNILLLIIQFIPLLIVLILFFPLFEQIHVEDYLLRDVLMNWRIDTYDPEYALFFISDWNISEFSRFSIFALVGIFVAHIYIMKAITQFLNNICLSQRTILWHRMLLRSLIIQALVPVILFIIPLTVATFIGYLNHLFDFLPVESMDLPAAQIGAFLITVPSFFSTVHAVTVIYFTAPYRAYVHTLMKSSRLSPAPSPDINLAGGSIVAQTI